MPDSGISNLSELAQKICLGPIPEDSAQDDAIIDSAFALTPIGSSLRFYNSPRLWQETISKALSTGPEHMLGHNALIRSLYTIVHSIGKHLVMSAKQGDHRLQGFARTAWTPIVPASGCKEWNHGIMQYVVTDRVIFAIAGQPGHVYKSTHKRMMQRKTLPSKFTDLYAKCVEWRETIRSFHSTLKSIYTHNRNRAIFSVENQGVAFPKGITKDSTGEETTNDQESQGIRTSGTQALSTNDDGDRQTSVGDSENQVGNVSPTGVFLFNFLTI